MNPPSVLRRFTGCGAGVEYLAVNPKGDIFPCHQFDNVLSYKMTFNDVAGADEEKEELRENSRISEKFQKVFGVGSEDTKRSAFGGTSGYR